jgi:ribose 5-phosphate isomerase B
MSRQPFTIITEADARGFERGETVVLAPGGHVTPLAEDTLREKRVTVVGSPASAVDLAELAPVADVRRVAIGGDHTAVAHKRAIRDRLRGRGLAVIDVGTDGPEAVDYPDIAAAVARLVARREADAGIVIDGAGLGSAIAANKIRGVRAAMCSSRTLARYAREHNGAHVITLGSTLVSEHEALEIVDVFLATPTIEPRYLRRLAKVTQLEQTG